MSALVCCYSPHPLGIVVKYTFQGGGGVYHLKAEVWFIQLPPPTVSVCMLCDGDVCRCMCALKGESALGFVCYETSCDKPRAMEETTLCLCTCLPWCRATHGVRLGHHIYIKCLLSLSLFLWSCLQECEQSREDFSWYQNQNFAVPGLFW